MVFLFFVGSLQLGDSIGVLKLPRPKSLSFGTEPSSSESLSTTNHTMPFLGSWIWAGSLVTVALVTSILFIAVFYRYRTRTLAGFTKDFE